MIFEKEICSERIRVKRQSLFNDNTSGWFKTFDLYFSGEHRLHAYYYEYKKTYPYENINNKTIVPQSIYRLINTLYEPYLLDHPHKST